MKIVKYGEAVVAIIEHSWEKSHLKAQQGSSEWVPLFLPDSTTAFAEIDPLGRHVRLCAGQELLDQQEVVFHVS